MLEAHTSALKKTTLGNVEEQFGDPFHLLVSCIISLRTKDAVTAEASRKLYERVTSAQDLADLPPDEIAALIYPAGFYRTKGDQLHRIGEILVERYGGKVPGSLGELESLPGVGRKTANLVLGLGFGVHAICVDTHVHRIPNRLGWVRTSTPLDTEKELQKLLPKCWWIPVNDILVTFGQNVCLPRGPKCMTCPVRDFCRKIDVENKQVNEAG